MYCPFSVGDNITCSRIIATIFFAFNFNLKKELYKVYDSNSSFSMSSLFHFFLFLLQTLSNWKKNNIGYFISVLAEIKY